MCKTCDIKPVYKTLNDKNLCKSCFIKYFEKKVLKTIRQYNLIDNKDEVAVGLSGGKDSMTCLYIMVRFMKKIGRQVKALLINEGIEGYRNKTIEDAEKLCKELKIPLKIVSLKKEFGKSIDDFYKSYKGRPCTPCGIFRRYLLNKYARNLRATKLATGHNLDDEAQSIIMNQIKGNMSLSAKLGPSTGVLVHKKFIRRIKPLYFMTEKEVTVYSYLKKFPLNYIECPYFHNTFRDNVGRMLNDMEVKYPGTKQSIVNAFIEILPKLRELYQGQEIGTCRVCKEPAAKERCKACELLNRT